jgi:methylated-DNA-[protein]-cysteine S-methyltransferase
MTHFYKIMPSPVGTVKLVASDQGLAAILWENDRPSRVRLGELVEDPSNPILVQAEKELGEYFAGERTKFDVKLDMVGTDFQKDVWNALLSIPFGETRSYRDIARQVRRPTAFRAVGAANGRNPISIITPCHRAIGSDGSLTGFAGGLGTKKYLLEHEAHSRQNGA